MYLLNQRLLCGAMSPVGREHESRNEEMAAEVGPFTTTPSDPVGYFVLHFSVARREYILARRYSQGPIELIYYGYYKITVEPCVPGPAGRKKCHHTGKGN